MTDLNGKLESLLADDELRKSMGEASRTIIENEINTAIHVNNYLELFQELTGHTLERYINPLVQENQ